MTRVLHVLDESCDETILQVVEALRSRRAGSSDADHFCLIDPQIQARVDFYIQGHLAIAPQRWGAAMQIAPQLRKIAEQTNVEVIHAWGVHAAVASAAQLPGRPLVVTLLDPSATREAANWVRSFPQDAAVVAGSQVIRSRLVTAGVAAERVVVIRGPVDFSAINKAREQNVRQEITGDARPVLLMTGPASRGGGQYVGLWAAAIVAQIHRGLRVILPYESQERDRLQRFTSQIEMEQMVIAPDRFMSWSELVSCADVFVAQAIDEICTESVASAMAAGLVVVGSAIRSVTELIADKHNGLLCKPGEARLLASRILTALEDEALVRNVTQVAKGHAYEVFSARAFADNYSKLYENLRARRAAGHEIQDTAMVA